QEGVADLTVREADPFSKMRTQRYKPCAPDKELEEHHYTKPGVDLRIHSLSSILHLLSSEIPLLVLIRYVLGRSDRQGHHRQRRVLAADRHEARAVRHEQVLNIPALIEPIQY